MKRTKGLRKTPLRRVSKKRQNELGLYYDKRTTFLKDKMCEFPKEPFGCRNMASDVHHKKGRLGKWLLIEKYWIPLCRTCHQFVEANKRTARKMGLILYK